MTQLYTFQTTATDYQQYNGRRCIIVRPLTDKEADLVETGPMFKVQFSETTEVIDAFEDELSKIE